MSIHAPAERDAGGNETMIEWACLLRISMDRNQDFLPAMTRILIFPTLALLGTIHAFASEAVVKPSSEQTLKLWYEKPAANWNEALPLGNGRLGAMVFGTPGKERMQLNEESLWAGCPVESYPPDYLKHLNEVRRLLFAGRNAEAHAYGENHLTASPTSFRSYEPLADLWLDFGSVDMFLG